MEELDIEKYRGELLGYTSGMILPSKKLLNLPDSVKLKLLQITPEKAIEEREIAGNIIPYVKIGYIERALNFVSNFNRGVEAKRESFKETIRQKKVWDKANKRRMTDKDGKLVTEPQKVFDARCLGHFRIIIDGNRIERSCYGTRQMFDNPAVSDYSVLEASRSMATKSFADTLGIGSDIADRTNEKLQEARKNMEIIEAPTMEEIANQIEQHNNQ